MSSTHSGPAGEPGRPAPTARPDAGAIRTLGYVGRHRAGPDAERAGAERPGGGTVARRSLCGRGVPAA